MIIIAPGLPRGDRNGAGKGRMRIDSPFGRGGGEGAEDGCRGWIVES
jgi:hypothetical protein